MHLKKFNIFNLLILVFVMVLVGQLSSQIYAERKKMRFDIKRNEQSEVLLSDLGFRLLSFGHLESSVDLLWIKFLQLEGIPSFYRYHLIDAVTRLDPAYYEASIFGASYLSVIDENPEGAKKILERANEFRKKNPNASTYEFAWTIPLTLGYVYLFDLQDMKSAEKVYIEAMNETGAPVYLKNFVLKFQSVEGKVDLGFRVLNLLELQTKTRPGLKKAVEDKRNGLNLFSFFYQSEKSYALFLKSKNLRRSASSFQKFLVNNSVFRFDPMGNRVYLNSDLKITSSTQFKVPFQIESADDIN